MSATAPATLDAPRRPEWKPEVQAAIDTAVERLVTEFKPEQVWLFGSYAWGEPDEHSDLDLVVVVSESDESPIKRMQRAHGCLRNLRMPKDVLVKTRSEFDRFRDVRPSMTCKIVNEGRLLHGTLRRAVAATPPSQEVPAVPRRAARTEAGAPPGTSCGEAPQLPLPAATFATLCLDAPISELVRAWLTKAQHSLAAARLLAADDDTVLANATYHCQQAGEKALKGYLAAQDQLIQKTADLKKLITECVACEPGFNQWVAEVTLLSPSVSSFRYPDEIPAVDPTRHEFDQFFAAAKRIYNFVLSLLPPETHPT